MKRWIPTLSAVLAALVLALVTGCAHHPKTSPTPTTTPVPPAAPIPAPQPTPPPTEAPAPSTTIRAEDLQPVFFDFDSAVLNDQARATLDRDAKTLRDHADVKVVIEGHCDERGTVEYNQALGERRAQAGRDYLVAP